MQFLTKLRLVCSRVSGIMIVVLFLERENRIINSQREWETLQLTMLDISLFVVVNFDALAQASDIRI